MDLFKELDQIGADTEDALERFMDDEEQYKKYIYSFPQEPTMGKLVEAVNAKDYEKATKEVHTLKGITLNLGFVPFADAAIDMLEELREGNIEDALEAYEDVQKEYTKYCKVINDCQQ